MISGGSDMKRMQFALAATLGALALPHAAHAQAVSFSKDIVPILKENCVKCHNNRQATGGFSVASFSSIEKGGKSGKILAPKAADAKLVKLIDGPKPAMPPGGALKPADVAKI